VAAEEEITVHSWSDSENVAAVEQDAVHQERLAGAVLADDSDSGYGALHAAEELPAFVCHDKFIAHQLDEWNRSPGSRHVLEQAETLKWARCFVQHAARARQPHPLNGRGPNRN
jgi:hypothetical protein